MIKNNNITQARSRLSLGEECGDHQIQVLLAADAVDCWFGAAWYF